MQVGRIDIPVNAPRITNQMIPKYVGQSVSVIGRVVRTFPGKTIIQTADKQELTVIMKQGSVVETEVVEFVGKVLVDFTLSELAHFPVEEGFDMEVHRETITVTQKYQRIF